MTRRTRALLAALLLPLLIADCAGSGKRKKEREVILKSEGVDEKVGRESAGDVRQQLGLIKDPLLVAYVNAVGQRLAAHAPRRQFKYTFQIVDQEAPNAFALPGGFIFVSRGLLTLTNSEDELANVLGHEIVHVAARHAAARQQMMSGALSWLQGRYLARYGREQEREADRLGQGLAAVAGYDPAGLGTFLRELEHTERLRLGTSRLPGFWDTHPSTGSRVAETAGRAKLAAWERVEPIASSRRDYLRRIDGLAIGPRAAEGVFVGESFLHADLDLALRFPSGWEMRNTHVAVGALAPGNDAQVFLEHQGPGEDVEAAASEYLQKLSEDGFRLDGSQPMTIGEHSALRVYGRLPGFASSVRIILTFLERGGSIYRFTAVARSSAAKRYEGVFLNVPRSLRSLRPGEFQKIRETRLRIATARGGERLGELNSRTQNRWTVQQTAVMNDVMVDHRLNAGELVKIAVLEGYEPVRAE
jgi:predicted Zn-dependent protease